MIVKLLTEHHLEFLSLKGGCTGSSESTLVSQRIYRALGSPIDLHIWTRFQLLLSHLLVLLLFYPHELDYECFVSAKALAGYWLLCWITRENGLIGYYGNIWRQKIRVLRTCFGPYPPPSTNETFTPRFFLLGCLNNCPCKWLLPLLWKQKWPPKEAKIGKWPFWNIFETFDREINTETKQIPILHFNKC